MAYNQLASWNRRQQEPNYGVILYTLIGNKLHYGMIKRRITYGLNAVMMGDWNDVSFSKLSHTEQQDLIHICSFQDNWDEILEYYWKITTSHKRYLPFSLETLKSHIISNAEFLLDKLRTTTLKFPNGVWEFPKGRREKNENPLQCALRETKEEIGLSQGSIHITSKQLLHEQYQHWRYAYFVANISAFDAENKHFDVGEISEIKWCGINEALNLISADMTDRKTILRNVDFSLCSQRRRN